MSSPRRRGSSHCKARGIERLLDSRFRGNDENISRQWGLARLRGDDDDIFSGEEKYRERGYILLPVVLLITLVAVVAFLLNNESALDSGITESVAESAQTDYVAQAGLQHALQQIRQSGCGPYTDLTDEPLGDHSYTTVLTSGLGSTTSYTVTVDQDAWIRSDVPTDNKAADGQLHIRFETGIIERPVYRYDLSAIPANASILSATAWFYVTDEHPEGPVDIHRLTTDWAENDATWDTLGDKMDAAVLATIPTQPAQDVWVPVNLTAQVQAWVNGQSNFGIALNSSSEGTHADYASREHGSQPYLTVIVGTPSSSSTKLRSKGLLSNGTSHTINRHDLTFYQHPPSHAQLRLDTGAGQDAMLSYWYDTKNYGDYRLRVVSSTSSPRHSLLQFDLGAIPAGARVMSAELQLYHTILESPGTDAGVSVHRVSRDWVEGTQGGTGTADGATWLYWDGTNPWASAGGDYDPAPVANSPVTDAIGDWESWDISTLVQGWVDGTFENNGLLLKGTGTIAVSFASKEDADATLHPKLRITYACECGSPCLAPQGMGNVLMVVVNPTTLVEADAKARSLFESWGYTVSVLSESANQSSYDAAVTAADVVFISETVNSTSVGSKLVNAPIGVVSQDGDYNADLGLAAGAALTVGDSINISDNSHYITQPFAPGDLDIYAADMEQLTVSASPGAGQQTLADSAGSESLVVLDAGAAMEGGGNAAGPRVMLPLGTRYRFDWDHLNANGHLLVQRALQWGTGNIGLPPKNLLLVVVDPASLTAQEAAKQALIESWGYTVNLIDESDSQANFDAAIAANDVAYIPQDITSSNLGTKLANATIGVVNEEGEQVDELGISAGKLFKTRREIDVVDNSHYITQPFATGLLTFTSVDQSVHMLSGQVAPGLQTLGESFNTGSQWEPSLGTLDAGDTLSDGTSTAVGRRVQLPWGGGTFDINQLTDDGRTIMQRAIEWAEGAGGASTMPIAHWTFDEGSGPTAFDSVGGNDATLNGDTAWTAGTINGALDFDGAGDYIRTDNNFTPPPVGTTTFWMRVPGSPASHGRILGLDDTWEIRHVTTGTADGIPHGLVFDLGVTGVNAEFVTTTTVDMPGKWYHIAAAYDTTSDAYAVYIDGVLHKSGTYPSALAVPAANLLSMGVRTGSSNYFDGQLDDVRIYDQFLSAAEIADLASGGGSQQEILLVVADATSLTAQDIARQTLMVDWGYRVATISASDSQANFDAAVATASAAYVVMQDSSTVLGTKLRDATIAVINEEVELRQDIGFSANRDWPTTRTTVDIIDNSHYITSPFATGLLTIATAAIEVVTLSGQMAGGLQALGQQDWGGPQNSLSVIDTGGALYGGGSAAGRRVQLPWGRVGFDINNLNADGLTIMQRAIEWGVAGGGGGGGGGGPGTCIFRDEFENQSYSNQDGNANWASAWQEVNDGGSPTGGDIRLEGGGVTGDSLRIQDDDRPITRAADLSGHTTATLTLEYKRVSLENGEYVAVSVYDGSTWTELQQFGNPPVGNDSNYQIYSEDISSYISPNFEIRLASPNGGMGNADDVKFDNVQIEASGGSCP